MDYIIGTTSLLGNRKANQDRVGIAEKPEAVLLVLADGMSGHAGGKLAANTFVNNVIQSFHNCKFPVGNPRKFMRDVITIANQDVIEAGARHNPPQQPRTTCVMALIQNGQACWAHVGDSRFYIFRHGYTHVRTVDHSKVAELRQQGKITEAQMLKHPERHIITRCIGTPKLRILPSVSETEELEHDDVLLLCTDGLWGAVSEETVRQYMEEPHLEESLEQLATQAETASYPNADNVSAVALKWNSKKGKKFIREEASEQEFDDLSEGLDAIDLVLKQLEQNK